MNDARTIALILALLTLSGCLYIGPRPICFHEPIPYEGMFGIMWCGCHWFDGRFHR